ERGCHRDLDAELVRPVRLALADALHFRRMQAVDFRPALMTVLLEHPPGQMQQLGEERLQTALLASDLAGDVADSAPEICSERAQRLVGPLELLGVGIALMLDQGELAHPR